MKNIHLILSVIFFVLVACAKDENLTQANVPLAGKWGGQGVEILASDTEVTMSFNCASGSIGQKVTLINNQFTEKGTYTVFTGNIPVNIEQTQPQTVQYEGKLVSDILTINIKSEDGKTLIGTYTVSKSVVAKIVKCM